jgi:hypothetical protein
MQKWKCFQSRNNFHRRFQVHHQKRGRFTTKSLRCESSEKCNNTKLKGDQLQDGHTFFVVWGFHHEDVAST